MALVPKIKPRESDNSFMVKDTTGMYNSQNTGGYGYQTIRPEWIDTALLIVEEVRTGKKSDPIDVAGSLGKIDGLFQVMPWDIDPSWKVFPVGKYKFSFSITATTPTGLKRSSSTEAFWVAIKQGECCLDKMTGKVRNVPFNSLFKDELSRKHAELSVLLRRVKDALTPECSDLNAADLMIYYISLNCNCNC